MTKEEHIAYWLKMAEDDWQVIDVLFNANKYLPALFFVHLSIEKICKANWIKDNATNHPPKIHNLLYLIDNSSLVLNTEERDFVHLLNDFQIEGRYPDYQKRMNVICDKVYSAEILRKAKIIKECLLSKML